jgi:hypothetical protein
MHQSLGMVSMTKRFFYPLFREAFRTAFTQKNILSAFEKPGIYPFNPSKVLDKLKSPEVPEAPVPVPVSEPSQLQTPKSCRAVRRVQKAYKKTHRPSLLNLVFKANVALASQVAVDQHVINGLHDALNLERQKRQRGKKLNLLGESNAGPQFFSPNQVRAGLAFQAEKTAAEQADRDLIAAKKVQSAANKVQKEAEKAERALQAAARRQHAEEEKVRKAAEKAQKANATKALQEAKLAESQAKKAAKLASKATAVPRTPIQRRTVKVVEKTDHGVACRTKVVAGQTKRGRAIIVPRRSL